MRFLTVQILGPLWGITEFVVAKIRYSGKYSGSKDRGSIYVIWTVSLVSIALAIAAAYTVRSTRFPLTPTGQAVGLIVFLIGFAIRFGSVLYLGRFFTPDVSIAPDHRLIDTGPYRFVRHPTYSGALLLLLGMGILFGNLASLLLVFIPTTTVLLWRIHIEEQALTEAFGDEYRHYSRRTKRLIPWLY